MDVGRRSFLGLVAALPFVRPAWTVARRIQANAVKRYVVTADVTSDESPDLALDGWTSHASQHLKKGDIFTIECVYEVHPHER
jgi:hypothetical protein